MRILLYNSIDIITTLSFINGAVALSILFLFHKKRIFFI